MMTSLFFFTFNFTCVVHFIPWSGTVLRPVYVTDLHSLLPTLMPTCITHFFI